MFVFLILCGLFFFWAKNNRLAKSPQEITLSMARSTSVANGRAEIWFAAAGDDEYLGGRIVEAAQTEVRCKENQQMVPVTSEPSEEVCGIRIRLLELKYGGFTGSHPIARFEITWEK